MTSDPPHSADETPTAVIPLGATRIVPLHAGRTMPRPPAGSPPTGPPLAGPPSPGSTLPGARPEPVPDPPVSGRRRLARYTTVAAVVALVAGGGTAAYATAGEVPRGTRVTGIDIGAKSRAEARRTVGEALGPRSFAPLTVTMNGKQFPLAQSDTGLVVEVAATVEQAAKGGPRLFGTREVQPVITLDKDKLQAALRKRLDPETATPRKAAIAYDGLTPKPTYPVPGRDIDAAEAARRVVTGWPHDGAVEIPVVQRPAAMTRAQVDALIDTVAEPAVAAPVTVTAGGKSFTLTPAMIAKSLVFRADAAGALAPAVDAKKLKAAAKKALAAVETEPKDATMAFTGGRPTPVPGAPGTTVDLNVLAADLLKVLPATGDREVRATLRQQAPETTEADVAKLGVKEKVSTFTTRFPGGLSSPRSQNIVTIAKEVDGALVKPGETFSLNGHTGDRNYAQGYKDAPVIVGGKLEPGVAGGASQFTTTLFNAAYYAGLEDVEHKPHSFYFDRYPAVIESTIFYPELDLKFKNTTPYGILIDTSHTAKTVTVAMWSTKYYDSVSTERSSRRNLTSPPTEYREPGPRCISTGGLPGFTQDAFRIIRKDGKVLQREKFTWRYDPEPRFICGTEPG